MEFFLSNLDDFDPASNDEFWANFSVGNNLTNFYVSSYGNISDGLCDGKWNIIPKYKEEFYWMVNLNEFKYHIHIIVAEIFILGSGIRSEIIHEDSNTLNNHFSNLSIGAHTYNYNIEEWRTNNKYPGYKISSFGKLITPTDYLSKSLPKPDGYITVSITIKKGSNSQIKLHRIIADTFINNLENKPCVNHIDGNRSNNNISNLEFVDIKENNERKVFTSITNSCNIRVIQYDLNYEQIQIWHSITDIKLFFKCSKIDYYVDTDKIYENFIWEREIQDEILEGEIWMVVDYKNCIINVSTKGRVKRLNGRISYGSKNDFGYMKFHFMGKIFLVHRLVMMAIEPIENFQNYVVDHIDFQKDNNEASNLRWLNQQENVLHSLNNGPRKNYNSKIAQVSMYRLDGKYLESFDSQVEAQEFTGILRPGICNCCKGNIKSSGGYMWKYKTDEKDIDPIEPPNHYIVSVTQYTLNGIFIKTFKSIIDAEKSTKILTTGICSCCIGKIKSSGGYMWRYTDDIIINENIEKISINANCSSVHQYDRNGKYIQTFESQTKAEEITGACKISDCCNENRKSSGGFMWKHAYDVEKGENIEPIKLNSNAVRVSKFNLKGEFIKTYNSLEEAERDTGALKTNISKCCRCKIKTSMNFIWKYTDKIT